MDTTPKYPIIDEVVRLARLTPPEGHVRMVLDTDTYNEIDDQFAVVHALRSPDKLSVEAIYAAPFQNHRSTGPGDGMEKSYDEIQRLLKLLGDANMSVFRGATEYLPPRDMPAATDVTRDLIDRALRSPVDDPLYVVAIGAITNIAAAIMIEPKIIEHIVIVWLGGHALHWRDAWEFNLKQDIRAAQIVLDCGVPLVLLPCMGVVDRLTTTIPELRECLAGKGALPDYLFHIVSDYNKTKKPIWSKVIWDVAATAYLINPAWVSTQIVHSPVLTDNCTWSTNNSRHFIRIANLVSRDGILTDVFAKIVGS